MLAIKLSKISSLPCGGTKFDLFLTRDSSSSSHPSKNSTRRTVRLNSDISFDNSCMFEFRGVGVNFNPFSSNLISVLFNFLCDKLTICISGFVVVMDFCMASVLGIKKIRIEIWIISPVWVASALWHVLILVIIILLVCHLFRIFLVRCSVVTLH